METVYADRCLEDGEVTSGLPLSDVYLDTALAPHQSPKAADSGLNLWEETDKIHKHKHKEHN